jgi:mannobiose 2-epimerase
MNTDLEKYEKELREELHSILGYWIRYAIDHENGGFVGRIGHNNNIDALAPKGSVLNSRILWTFSAAFRLTRETVYLQMAQRAFQYFVQYFIDKENGGVFWTVGHKGEPLDTKKQFYALAFAIYGLSEFYKASGSEEAKRHAIELYHDMEKHGHDAKQKGYLEALDRNWQTMDDLRLSEKDANEPRSMNTHLHVLEAYANLYTIWPGDLLKNNLVELVNIFTKHIIDHTTGHLGLFFSEKWEPRSNTYSFGHDIEAAWLVLEAAELAGDKDLLEKLRSSSIKLAEAALEGMDKDGGLWYELDKDNDHLIKQKHSWPQAEAMVGFFNAFQLTGDYKYLQLSFNSWNFIKQHIRDASGEWYWGIFEDHSPMINEDKVGVWKCPYHNSRACIEIINRIKQVQNKNTYEKHELPS